VAIRRLSGKDLQAPVGVPDRECCRKAYGQADGFSGSSPLPGGYVSRRSRPANKWCRMAGSLERVRRWQSRGSTIGTLGILMYRAGTTIPRKASQSQPAATRRSRPIGSRRPSTRTRRGRRRKQRTSGGRTPETPGRQARARVGPAQVAAAATPMRTAGRGAASTVRCLSWRHRLVRRRLEVGQCLAWGALASSTDTERRRNAGFAFWRRV